MKRLVGFAGMLLASSAAAGEPGHSILQSATVTKPGAVIAGHKVQPAGSAKLARATDRRQSWR
jgi:hypothetical protein